MSKPSIILMLIATALMEINVSKCFIFTNIAGKTWPLFYPDDILKGGKAKCPTVEKATATENGKFCQRGWIQYPHCDIPDKRNFGSCKRIDNADFSVMDDTIQLRSISCNSRKMKCMGESGVISGDIELLYYPRNALSDKDELAETLSHLKDLSAVNFARNNFEFLSEKTFENNPRLFSVNFDNNFLWSIPENIFQQNRKLVSVSFKANKLDYLPGKLFRHNTILFNINFQRNNITLLQSDIFQRNVRLERADLSQNMIYDLLPQTFQSNENLQQLDLSFNRIKRIPRLLFHKNVKLSDLKMSGNRVTTIPSHLFDNCPDLRSVVFDRNQISTLPAKLFLRNPKLTYVDFSYNRLHTVRRDIFIDSGYVAIMNSQWTEQTGILESEGKVDNRKKDGSPWYKSYRKST